jgi:AraC-like DNA-binding protein
VRDGAAAVVKIPRERRASLASLFRELDALKPGDADEVVQRSLATLILAEVERATSDGGHRTARGCVVVDALRFIERNGLGRITPRDVAAAVERSPAYLTTTLRQATGRSAGEWIVAGRMAEARRLPGWLPGSSVPTVDVVQLRLVKAPPHVLDEVRVHVEREHLPAGADGIAQMHREVAGAGADVGDDLAAGDPGCCDDQLGPLPLVAAGIVEVCPLLGGAVVVAMPGAGRHEAAARRGLPVKVASPT